MTSINLPGPWEYGSRPIDDGTYQATVWVGANYERRQEHRWASPERYASALEANHAARDYLRRIEQVGGPSFMRATLRLAPARR